MPQAPNKPTQETKTEEKKNCAGCNKPFKKVQRYYRNGQYYCNRRCWNDKAKKEAAEAQSKAEVKTEPAA